SFRFQIDLRLTRAYIIHEALYIGATNVFYLTIPEQWFYMSGNSTPINVECTWPFGAIPFSENGPFLCGFQIKIAELRDRDRGMIEAPQLGHIFTCNDPPEQHLCACACLLNRDPAVKANHVTAGTASHPILDEVCALAARIYAATETSYIYVPQEDV
ncbi:MAG TPA: hypothetical protein VFG64_10305, partial [Dongiaceae bacterium]|nr:hypothetical protein [Dongiaceae bacterium]